MILKAAPALPFLAVRATYPRFEDVAAALQDISRAVRGQLPAAARAHLAVVAHSDFDDENFDLEIGVTLTRQVNKPVRLASRAELTLTELPASDSLATIVRAGPLHQSHLAFARLGVWMEANGYRIAGPCRELFLEMPFEVPGQQDPAMEIQFPVAQVIQPRAA